MPTERRRWEDIHERLSIRQLGANLDTLINLGLFLLAGAALAVSYLGYKTASRAEERSQAADKRSQAADERSREADERNRAAEQRNRVRFDYHDSEPFGFYKGGVRITLLHTGTSEVGTVKLDVTLLSRWAVHTGTALGDYSPGETVSFEISRNDRGLLPDSLRLTWREPVEGSQNVALPPSLVKQPVRPSLPIEQSWQTPEGSTSDKG